MFPKTGAAASHSTWMDVSTLAEHTGRHRGMPQGMLQPEVNNGGHGTNDTHVCHAVICC